MGAEIKLETIKVVVDDDDCGLNEWASDYEL